MGYETDKGQAHRHWINELKSSDKEVQAWHDQCKNIINVYLDKRKKGDSRARKYNLFNTNINLVRDSLIGKIPKPDVSRRFKDFSDQPGRVASQLVQRSLITELETDGYTTSTAKNAIKDRLLTGLGLCRVSYRHTAQDAEPVSISDNVDA